MAVRPPNDFPNNRHVHRIMRFRLPQSNVPLNFLDATLERVPEIHIAVLVNISVLSRLQSVGMLPVRRFRQVYKHDVPGVPPRLRDQNPQMVNSTIGTPDERVADLHFGSSPLQRSLRALDRLNLKRDPLDLVLILNDLA